MSTTQSAVTWQTVSHDIVITSCSVQTIPTMQIHSHNGNCVWRPDSCHALSPVYTVILVMHTPIDDNWPHKFVVGYKPSSQHRILPWTSKAQAITIRQLSPLIAAKSVVPIEFIIVLTWQCPCCEDLASVLERPNVAINGHLPVSWSLRLSCHLIQLPRLFYESQIAIVSDTCHCT